MEMAKRLKLTPIVLLAILLSAFSFFPAGNVSADGRVWYVGGSGEGNFSSIQDAIKYAKDGDTIFVYNGIYCEDIRVYKKLKIIGENASSTIIIGTETAVKIIAQDVLLYNFTIETKTKKETVAISLESPYCNIKNCIMRNSEKGLHIKGENNKITNCYIVNNKCGIHIKGNYTFIKKNVFRNNTHFDILLHAFSNRINDNEFIDGGGIFVAETGRNKIDGDGIGDKPYLISGGGIDRCPMMQPYEHFLLVKKPIEGYLYVFDRGILPVGTKRAVVIGDITIEGSAMGISWISVMDEKGQIIFYAEKMPFEYKWDLTAGFHTLIIRGMYKYSIVCTKEIKIFAIS